MFHPGRMGAFTFSIHFTTAKADAAEVARILGTGPIWQTDCRAGFLWLTTGRKRGDDETIVWTLATLLGDIGFSIDWAKSDY